MAGECGVAGTIERHLPRVCLKTLNQIILLTPREGGGYSCRGSVEEVRGEEERERTKKKKGGGGGGQNPKKKKNLVC
jgi:hypothetical protein